MIDCQDVNAGNPAFETILKSCIVLFPGARVQKYLKVNLEPLIIAENKDMLRKPNIREFQQLQEPTGNSSQSPKVEQCKQQNKSHSWGQQRGSTAKDAGCDAATSSPVPSWKIGQVVGALSSIRL